MIRVGLARFFVVLSTGLLLAASAGAAVITFDDLNLPSLTPVSNGYQGLNWSNFAVHTSEALSGYASGLVSAPNDAFNLKGNPSNFSSGTPLTFISGYFTGAWNDGLNITIQGLNGATILDSETIIVSATAPTLETFNWTGLTEVTFTSFGGTPNPTYGDTGQGVQFVLDNLTINAVPEPGMTLMVGVGLGGLILLRRKRFRVPAVRRRTGGDSVRTPRAILSGT